MNEIVKNVVDFVYGKDSAVKKFKKLYPNETIYAANGCKAIQGKNSDITSGIEWLISKKCIIILTEKRVYCGGWDIPIQSISNQEMVKINAIISTGQVLNLECDYGINYQFGMQFNKDWIMQKVLPVEFTDKKIKLTTYNIIMRIVFVLIITVFVLRLVKII